MALRATQHRHPAWRARGTLQRARHGCGGNGIAVYLVPGPGGGGGIISPAGTGVINSPVGTGVINSPAGLIGKRRLLPVWVKGAFYRSGKRRLFRYWEKAPFPLMGKGAFYR